MTHASPSPRTTAWKLRHRVWNGSGVLTALLLAYLVLLPTLVTAAEFQEVTDFGTNPGRLGMYIYLPAGLPDSPPLVVSLHGCLQQARSYANDAGWTDCADRWKFAVLSPDQTPQGNANECFNWYVSKNNERDHGEALSIWQMIEKMKTAYHVNPHRIYVTGLSAGGAMTAVMLATYPEEFAGGAIIAGLPYKCATAIHDTAFPIPIDPPSKTNMELTWALIAMQGMVDHTPDQWGNFVRKAANYSGPRPHVSIWHSADDQTVKFKNGTELLEQWTNVAGIDQTPDLQEKIGNHIHRVYKDSQGHPLVEFYELHGISHGTPVDPGTGETQGGHTSQFVFDADIFSSYWIVKFWGLDKAETPQ